MVSPSYRFTMFEDLRGTPSTGRLRGSKNLHRGAFS